MPLGEVIGYLRVSTSEQNTSSQKLLIEERYKVSKWFVDYATSGTVKGRDRKGLGELFDYVRKGDTVVVYAIDRLGRNTIDVLESVDRLNEKEVSLISLREGFDLTSDHGKLLLTMLAGLAELERKNIKARQLAGIQRAKSEGVKVGRNKKINDHEVKEWRLKNNASIKETAIKFSISIASVKRAMNL